MFDEESHIKNLLKWLVQEVQSACGDGDAFWFTEHHNLDYLFSLINEVDNELNLKWLVDFHYTIDDGWHISWHQGQQAITITNSQELWDKRPNWTQCAIKC